MQIKMAGLIFLFIIIAGTASAVWGANLDGVVNKACQAGCAEFPVMIPASRQLCVEACVYHIKDAVFTGGMIAEAACPSGTVQVFEDAAGVTCVSSQKLHGVCPVGQVPIQPQGSPVPVCVNVTF